MDHCPAPHSRGKLRKYGWAGGRLALAALIAALLLWFTGCMERMFYYPAAEDTPVPPELAQRGAESVWFQSGDGTRLHGWFIPSHLGSADSPTILHVHGNAGNIESHAWFTAYLPRAGFNVFIFDYRGYGQSEGVARSRAPLIADTHAALDAMLKRSDVDPNRIGMYGQSLGGAIGLNVMAERAELRAAVVESAFASWREMAACALGGDDPNLVCRSVAGMLIPDSHRPDEAIGKIKRPILLMHGDSDRVIPMSHSRKLAAANPNAKLVILAGGDHNTLRDSNPEVEQIVIDFLREHLSQAVTSER